MAASTRRTCSTRGWSVSRTSGSITPRCSATRPSRSWARRSPSWRPGPSSCWASSRTSWPSARPGEAEERGARSVLRVSPEDLAIAEGLLAAGYQRPNAALALACARAFLDPQPLAVAAARRAIAIAAPPGRLELRPGPPLELRDGAHNPHGMRALVGELDATLGDRRPRVALVALQGGQGRGRHPRAARAARRPRDHDVERRDRRARSRRGRRARAGRRRDGRRVRRTSTRPCARPARRPARRAPS